jgi:hypothetical protein
MDGENLAVVESAPKRECKLLSENNKDKYHDAIYMLLGEYPDNFFPGEFESLAEEDFKNGVIAVAMDANVPIGCLFLNPGNLECNWLAISKSVSARKSEVAKKLFETVFRSVPAGSKVFWYINTEDAVFEGKPVGVHFEPARRLYTSMGAKFTKVDDKFGKGNHAYLVEMVT